MHSGFRIQAFDEEPHRTRARRGEEARATKLKAQGSRLKARLSALGHGPSNAQRTAFEVWTLHVGSVGSVCLSTNGTA